MNDIISRLATVFAVSLSLTSVACSSEPAHEADTASVDVSQGTSVNAIGDIKAVVVTKCIRTYTGSCDAFKISCSLSGGKLEGSVPGQNGELFVWTCTK